MAERRRPPTPRRDRPCERTRPSHAEDSPAYDLPQLLEGIPSVAGDVPLIGCSTASEIAPAGPGAASVVVTALGGDGISVTTAAATKAGGRLRAASAEAAACAMDNEARPYQVLLMLTDGFGGNQHTAEGLETPDQHIRLPEVGCGLGQGFVFARPMSAGDIDAYLQREAASASVSTSKAAPANGYL